MERLLGSAWWVHGSGTVDGWDLANRFIVGTLCQYQKGRVTLLHIPWWWFPNWYYVNQKLLGDGKVSRGHHSHHSWCLILSCYWLGGRTVDPTYTHLLLDGKVWREQLSLFRSTFWVETWKGWFAFIMILGCKLLSCEEIYWNRHKTISQCLNQKNIFTFIAY